MKAEGDVAGGPGGEECGGGGAEGQSLEDSVKGGGGIWGGVAGGGEGLGWLAEVRDGDGAEGGGLVVVWMPKSSSLGEKTMVEWGVCGVGRVTVWVGALAAVR